MKSKTTIPVMCLFGFTTMGVSAAGEKNPPTGAKDGLAWESAIPDDCPFPRSTNLTGIYFTGRHSDYRLAHTWYPSWASDGNLYSPFTDGKVDGVPSGSGTGANSETGHAVMIGDAPLKLVITNTSLPKVARALPYHGRYPAGSLVHNGFWYYGTYCRGPAGRFQHGGFVWNWPNLGPMPGFQISRDCGQPGPPGTAFQPNPECEGGFAHANLSWITADQVYLARVKPSPETMNQLAAYEFFAGHDGNGKPVWTADFAKIKPLIEWNNHMGCVTATYVPGLKKYLMCITDGWPTVAKMTSYILEADAITGPWRMVVHMKDFGEQAYFLNFPSKFISADGRTLWLCYSANFSPGWNGVTLNFNPPGGRYGLCLHEVRLLGPGGN